MLSDSPFFVRQIFTKKLDAFNGQKWYFLNSESL